MIKTTLNIEGMMCGRCEAHMNEAIRKAFQVEQVSSSHSQNQTVIQSEAPLDEEGLKLAVASAGYTLKSISVQSCE